MSKFLAPIHQMMYNKIKNQDKINKDLVGFFGRNELLEEVETTIGSLKDGNLEEIIDLQNIHGWLQSQIDIVEESFSQIVRGLLERGVNEKELLKWFENRGKLEKSASKGEEVFRIFSDYFLDGMPCDRAIQPIELEENSAKWIQNIDVHKKYWEDEGELYNKLRCAWISGMAENSGFEFNKDGDIYEVRRW